MTDPTLHTTQLKGWLDRIQAGDPVARNELVQAIQGRLEQLARRMLRRYPTVARWAETGDVFQGAVMRLLRALETVSPASTRDFLNLAAAIVRRELIDLARHFQGPQGLGANHASGLQEGQAGPETNPADLESWTALHEAVDRLPVELREVFGLTFYHGWTQQQIAELFAVDVRTVRRRWLAACQVLVDALGNNLPEL
jgi:RNA polymerase sigma-70 factor (ECF subfamily)